VLGCAELDILGNAEDHELPIQVASTIACDRVETIDVGLLEEGTDRITGPIKPSL